jgi:hypothetical protein
MSKSIVSKNTIVQNVFSNEQIASIYKDIDIDFNKNIMLQSFYGRLYIPLYFRQKTVISDPIDLKVEQSICDTILSHSSKFSDVSLQVESISFARYSLKYGKPGLHPHTDNNYKEARLTFDIQLDGNVSWPIIIDHKEYLLKNNEAIVFSGTHDVHWRSKKQFNENEYIDILLCQLSEKSNSVKLLDNEFINNITTKQKVLKIKYDKGII